MEFILSNVRSLKICSKVEYVTYTKVWSDTGGLTVNDSILFSNKE